MIIILTKPRFNPNLVRVWSIPPLHHNVKMANHTETTLWLVKLKRRKSIKTIFIQDINPKWHHKYKWDDTSLFCKIFLYDMCMLLCVVKQQRNATGINANTSNNSIQQNKRPDQSAIQSKNRLFEWELTRYLPVSNYDKEEYELYLRNIPPSITLVRLLAIFPSETVAWKINPSMRSQNAKSCHHAWKIHPSMRSQNAKSCQNAICNRNTWKHREHKMLKNLRLVAYKIGNAK